MRFETIGAMIQQQAERSPESPALHAPGRHSLSYAGLYDHMYRTMQQLNAFGIGRNDPVAIVLPNGPEMAAAFLSIAACATSAPLNPNYRQSEYSFYLTDLEAKALIVMQGEETDARAAAMANDIPIIELRVDPDQPAGVFKLLGLPLQADCQGGWAESEDVALVLHTSGTTSRPKIVPLSQSNLCASAEHIRSTLKLTSQDRCLNVMPLFHIHGLMAATMASMCAAASIVCTPGFFAPQFFPWLSDHQPTWYSAVPTMHQAILDRAAENQDILSKTQLRFVRSSSASLAPQVMEQLEIAFNAPVIEAYGMTEASHQMTSNPLPPQTRKPGSVGMAAGPEMRIMAEDGPQLLGADQVGEIVIRGPNVTKGYANNPEANASAFSEGWFRTGDQGYLDQDGYLFITGRLKEIINRGGEKISPREVDEVLLDHPAVTQVVAFAMPDAKLGEDVAAAVTVNDPQVSELELRRFSALRLADFKVPRRILVLDEIPKGPTGKLQRIGLAEKLGLSADPAAPAKDISYVAPRTPTEELLHSIWRQVLGLERVGMNDPFLDLGGDSVLATQLLSRLREALDLEIDLIAFFDAPTLAEQAQLVEDLLLQEFDDGQA